MLDQPITLRTLIYLFLFVVFFPFSLVFVFPRTALFACCVILGSLLIVTAREPVVRDIGASWQSECPHGLTDDKRACWFPTRVDTRRADWTEVQARCAGLKGEAETACFEKGLD